MSVHLRRVGNWNKAKRTLIVAPAVLKSAVKRALMQEGQFYRRKMVEGIRNQAPGGKPWVPLKASTIAARRDAGFRGTKALIRTGDLRNSIVAKRVPSGVFVGVLRGARGRNGQDLVNVGLVHEHGAVITQKLTQRQINFFNARNFAAGRGRTRFKAGDVIVIRIPARPFVRPVFDKWGGSKGAQRFRARVVQNSLGTLGKPVSLPHT